MTRKRAGHNSLVSRRLIFLLGSFAILAMALWHWNRQSLPPEPSFEGRQFSEWLLELDYSLSPAHVRASNAIAHIGTNALPHLRPLFEARDSWVKPYILATEKKIGLRLLARASADEKKQRASRACRVLHGSAVEYVPNLVQMLNSTNFVTAWCGLVALIDVKPIKEVVPELTMGLTNRNAQVRWTAAGYLGRAGVASLSVVPELQKCLSDPDYRVRSNARRALDEINYDRVPHQPEVRL